MPMPNRGSGDVSTASFGPEVAALGTVVHLRNAELGFGRFECLSDPLWRTVLDPWPTTVREWKLASNPHSTPEPQTNAFELKRQLREFVQFVRPIESGAIRQLDIRHGPPFSMEFDAGQSVEGRPVAPVE